MLRRLAKFGGISTLVIIFFTLFDVINIESRARAPQLQAREESTAWTTFGIALGVVGLAAYAGPTGSMHYAWAGGKLVLYPGGIGQAVEFYVDGANGAAGNSGLSWNEAVSTIQAAIDLTTSGQGDRVYIAPKATAYAENLTITSKDYVHLIGVLLPGYARPDVAPAAGKALNIQASQGTVLEHMRFLSADDDSVLNEGNGFYFRDCVFDGATGQAATEANLRLVGDATDDSYTASEGKIIECLFRASGGIGLLFQHAALTSGVGVSDVEVLGCRFYGNTGADIATAANTSGGGVGIVQNVLIHGNRFMDVDKATYLDMDQASNVPGDELLNTGMISGNYFADDAALDATKIDISGTKLRFVGNYNAVGVVDGSTFDN